MKKNYIPVRLLISFWLFVFGASRQTSYVMGRWAAHLCYCSNEDAIAIKERLPKIKQFSVGKKILWALICLSTEKPKIFLLTFLGLAAAVVGQVLRFLR